MFTIIMCGANIKVLLMLALAGLLGQAENGVASSDLQVQCRKLSLSILSNESCPPWTNEECLCQKDYFDGELRCDKNTKALSVLDCHCMTYDEVNDVIEVGACVENCMNLGTKKKFHDVLYLLELSPKDNLSILNEEMCQKRFNRAGRLCGKCMPGYSPQAYSFNLTCVNCTEGNQNLWKYFVYSLTPLTIFYFFVLFFKVNTTSAHLHGYVTFAQAIALPLSARLVLLALRTENSLTNAVECLGSLFGIWNLDFFRGFNLGICLDMAPLTVLALDYIIAVYPFFLTVISYTLIELHGRNYRLLVWIWKPFRCIFTLFRRNWDIHTSIVDAYATFFLLSSFKILCISFDLLAPTFVYKVGHPKEDATLVVYFDGTVDFFGHEHLPYAVVAIIFSLLFVVFPTLLLLIYPCRCFQYLLNHCHFHSHILQTFMDSLNGCYKDGTEPGTRDYRWFASLDFTCRIFLFIVFLATKGALYYPFAVLVLIFLIILLCNLQPHKRTEAHYLKIDVTFYSLLALFYTALSGCDIAGTKAQFFAPGAYVLACIIAFIPLLYMACLSIHWLFVRRRWGKTFVDRLTAWRRGYDLLEESLPDRLNNPEQYSEQLDNAAGGSIHHTSNGSSVISVNTYGLF